jgi:hypothetical protein
MRGILIAAALVLVVVGAGVAGYAATKDDDDSAGLSSRDAGSGSQLAASAPDSSSPASPDSSGAPTATTGVPPTSPDSPPADSSTSPDASPTETSPASPTAPPRGSAKAQALEIPPAREFSGTGNKRLGTVDLRVTSILRWRSQGHFEVRFGREDFSILAPTKSGQLVVPAFRFDKVRVLARGRWKITVTPQR